MSGPRFKVEPRDVPPAAAARVLGLTEATFMARLPELLARGFPGPDPTTGCFDLKAVAAWQDRRSGFKGHLPELTAVDATTVVKSRLRDWKP